MFPHEKLLGFFPKKLNFPRSCLWNFIVMSCTFSPLATLTFQSYWTTHSNLYLTFSSGEDMVELWTWLMEEQKHKGVGHVSIFSQNTFYFVLRESEISINWLLCLPKDKHFTSLVLHVCRKQWDIFYIFSQTAVMQPGIFGSAFGNFLGETPLLQPFLLFFSCPFTSDCQMVLPPS